MDDIEGVTGMTGMATILYLSHLSNIKTGVFRERAFDIFRV